MHRWLLGVHPVSVVSTCTAACFGFTRFLRYLYALLAASSSPRFCGIYMRCCLLQVHPVSAVSTCTLAASGSPRFCGIYMHAACFGFTRFLWYLHAHWLLRVHPVSALSTCTAACFGLASFCGIYMHAGCFRLAVSAISSCTPASRTPLPEFYMKNRIDFPLKR